MDLLEKIQFNKVIHGAMAQIHSPLLSHQDIQDVQTNLNNLLVHCSYEQIVKQTHMLLQQTTLKSTALNYAESTKYFKYYAGMVFSPIELVEHLTQKDGIGWGLLCKNNSLWQIFLKQNDTKNIEYSIWVDNLNELTPWLTSKFENLTKTSETENQPNTQNIASTDAPVSDELLALDATFSGANGTKNSSEDDFNQLLLDSQIKKKEADVDDDLPSFDFSSDVVNPFTAMKAELEQEKTAQTAPQTQALTTAVTTNNAVDTSAPMQTTTEQKNPVQTAPDEIALDDAVDSTVNKQEELIKNESISNLSDEALLETAKQQAIAHLTPQQQLALIPELIDQIANALVEKFKTEQLATLPASLVATNTTQQQTTVQATKSENTVKQATLAVDNSPKQVAPKQTTATANKPAKSTLDFSFTLDSLLESKPAPKSTESVTIDFSSPSPIVLPINQKNTTTTNNILSKSQPVEEWDCHFELGTELDSTYYYIQLKKYIPYLNLIALNTDMTAIQYQPIYMVEVIDEQNQFKHYAFIFGADNNNQAINFINQLAHHQQDHLAHISQITWREFKEHAFDLSLCCQLYHTSPVIMRSTSLYSHISESLISKQQMLYISETEANTSTPLLLLQENNRFRVIHGRNRLNMGASLNMYPCLILSRSSGVTWQMIREQLKFLPENVNVYQLFEALQHSSKN